MSLMKLNNCGYLPLWEKLNQRFSELAKEQSTLKNYSVAWAAKSAECNDRVGFEMKEIITESAKEYLQ